MKKYLNKIAASRQAKRDQGWTFIEATFSVVLMSIIFLGFTVSIMAYREWMERRWAIRVMDQYANDVLVKVDSLMREAANCYPLSSQNGLGSFYLSLYNFSQSPVLFRDSTVYVFSAHPINGVMMARGFTAPQHFDANFPNDNADNDNIFRVMDFGFTPSTEPYRPDYFNESIGEVYLKMLYQRPRIFFSSFGNSSNTYSLEKSYTVTVFMKNHIDSRASSN